MWRILWTRKYIFIACAVVVPCVFVDSAAIAVFFLARQTYGWRVGLAHYRAVAQLSRVQALDLKESYDEAASLATTKPAATCFCAKAAGAASPTV